MAFLLAQEKPQSEVSSEVVDAPKNNNELLKKKRETPKKRNETSHEMSGMPVQTQHVSITQNISNYKLLSNSKLKNI